MGKAHILVIPFPAQGHVIPLLELSNLLVEHGFKITFVNTDFNHTRVISSLRNKENHDDQNRIHLVSVPDGMGPEEDRNQIGSLSESILRSMPPHLEELIGKINESNDDEITYIIADEVMGWVVQVAKKMGIPFAAFWPAAVAVRVLTQHIPKLIEEGVIDANGTPLNHQVIHLSPTMPPMNTTHFAWSCIGDPIAQRTFFRYLFTSTQATKDVEWLLCNSFYEIEEPAFQLNSNLLPIGPLLASNHKDTIHGNFWPEDPTCLHWLDKQAPCSVIYVAFGSITVFNQHQFHELALGLELTGQPFLWVVRPDLIEGPSATYPDGFQARVGTRGRMVGWAPQQQLLRHPSIACFLTHCGWNSTMEGLSFGVPFLSWPYFADQLFNQTYISDVWKIGLKLNPEENGIITREEINKKVRDLFGDENIRARALEMKEMAKKSISDAGSSKKNFNNFIEAIKGK